MRPARRHGRLQQWRRPCQPRTVHQRRLAQGHRPQWQGFWRCAQCPAQGPHLAKRLCLRMHPTGGRRATSKRPPPWTLSHGASAPLPPHTPLPRKNGHSNDVAGSPRLGLPKGGPALHTYSMSSEVMGGAAVVVEQPLPREQVDSNSGDGHVWRCHLFSASALRDTVCPSTGGGIVQPAPLRQFAPPPSDAEDPPRPLDRQALASGNLPPQAMVSYRIPRSHAMRRLSALLL